MIVFPFCKINLGLNVVGVRPDGYHDIESVILPVSMADVLEIAFPDNAQAEYSLDCSGNPVAVPPEKNLCVKALKVIKQVADVPRVSMHLHKVIPDGAGLGGGSSDAAHVIRTVNDMLGLHLSVDAMRALAAKVGADCPFFIEGRPTFVTGIGDVFSSVDVSQLRGMGVAIAVPQGGVSTAEAYANIPVGRTPVSIKEAVTHNVGEWKTLIHNDFEPYAESKIPDIARFKENFYRLGAVYSQMSGSGSSVFALFPQGAALPAHSDFPQARCYWCGKLNF